MKQFFMLLLLCVTTFASAQISVRVTTGGSASCAIQCLKQDVKNAGHVIPCSVYTIVRGMNFIDTSSNTSMIVFTGDVFSYDTFARTITFTSVKTGETIVFSCIGCTNVQSMATETRAYIVTFAGVCQCADTVKSVSTNSVNHKAAKRATVQVKHHNSVVANHVDYVPNCAYERGGCMANVVQTCLLATASRNGDTAQSLNIDGKLQTVSNAELHAEWAYVLPILERSFQKDSRSYGELARSFLCTDDLMKYRLNSTASIYFIKDAGSWRNAEIVIDKQQPCVHYFLNGYEQAIYCDDE